MSRKRRSVRDGSGTDMDARPVRIVFVEDSSSDVELMVWALRQSGWEPDWIRVADTRGLETALKTGPDVIISDYYMPGLTGMDVLLECKRQKLSAPVVMVSAGMPHSSEDQIIRLGAVAFVRKDQLGRLGQVVDEALGPEVDEEASGGAGLAETSGRV